jgi:hypothetical protein
MRGYAAPTPKLRREWCMNSGRTIFAQVMNFRPLTEFRRFVVRYRGDYKSPEFLLLGPVPVSGLCTTHRAEDCAHNWNYSTYDGQHWLKFTYFSSFGQCTLDGDATRVTPSADLVIRSSI